MFYRLLGRFVFYFWILPRVAKIGGAFFSLLGKNLTDRAKEELAKRESPTSPSPTIHTPSRTILHTPSEWEEIEGFQISENAGWVNEEDPKSWTEPITRREFYERAGRSTVKLPKATQAE